MNKIILFTIGIFTVASCSTTPESEYVVGPPVSEGFIQTRGAELYVKTIGQGEPLLIIHGGPVLDHSYFLPYLMPLADDYQLIFYDQRLSGNSSNSSDSSAVSFTGFVEDVEAVREYFQIDRMNLLSHSWGGLIALLYSIEHPDRLNKLILSDPMAASAVEWRQEEALLAEKITEEYLTHRNNLISSDSMKTHPSSVIKQLLLESFKLQMYHKDAADSIYLNIPEDYIARSEKFSMLSTDLADYNLYMDLPAIQVATLLIYDKADVSAARSGKHLAEMLPNAQYELIKESGHFPFIEQPEEFNKMVAKFLKSK